MKTSGNLIKLDKHDIENFRRQKSFIDAWNQKMVMLRQKQIYTALNTATKTKIDFFQKVSKWMNLLETKVFDQQVIDAMDLNKAISLIKFVSTVSLKLMAQMNAMEDVFKAYVELNANVPDQKPVQQDTGLGDTKKELYEILAGIAKNGSTEVTPNESGIEIEKISSTPEVVNLEDQKEKIDILSPTESKNGESEDSPFDGEIVDIDVNMDSET